MTDRATIDPRASASHGTRMQEDAVTMKKVGRILAAMAAAALLALSAAARAEENRPGILLQAHGAHAHPGHGRHSAVGVWNANVEQLARGLDRQRPTEVAFGVNVNGHECVGHGRVISIHEGSISGIKTRAPPKPNIVSAAEKTNDARLNPCAGGLNRMPGRLSSVSGAP